MVRTSRLPGSRDDKDLLEAGEAALGPSEAQYKGGFGMISSIRELTPAP